MKSGVRLRVPFIMPVDLVGFSFSCQPLPVSGICLCLTCFASIDHASMDCPRARALIMHKPCMVIFSRARAHIYAQSHSLSHSPIHPARPLARARAHPPTRSLTSHYHVFVKRRQLEVRTAQDGDNHVGFRDLPLGLCRVFAAASHSRQTSQILQDGIHNGLDTIPRVSNHTDTQSPPAPPAPPHPPHTYPHSSGLGARCRGSHRSQAGKLLESNTPNPRDLGQLYTLHLGLRRCPGAYVRARVRVS